MQSLPHCHHQASYTLKTITEYISNNFKSSILEDLNNDQALSSAGSPLSCLPFQDHPLSATMICINSTNAVSPLSITTKLPAISRLSPRYNYTDLETSVSTMITESLHSSFITELSVISRLSSKYNSTDSKI